MCYCLNWRWLRLGPGVILMTHPPLCAFHSWQLWKAKLTRECRETPIGRNSKRLSCFYGVNQQRLRSIRAKYDQPNEIFYATTAVGSDEWEIENPWRFCSVSLITDRKQIQETTIWSVGETQKRKSTLILRDTCRWTIPDDLDEAWGYEWYGSCCMTGSVPCGCSDFLPTLRDHWCRGCVAWKSATFSAIWAWKLHRL